MRSPIFHTTFPRSDGVIRPHGPSSKAARAALTARSISSAPPDATVASGSPVAGLGVVNVSPDAELTHFPPMKSWWVVWVNSFT